MALPVGVLKLVGKNVIFQVQRNQVVDADGDVHEINSEGECQRSPGVKHRVNNAGFFRADVATIGWGDQREFATIIYRHDIPEQEERKRISRWATDEMPKDIEMLVGVVSDVLAKREESTLKRLSMAFHPLQSDKPQHTLP